MSSQVGQVFRCIFPRYCELLSEGAAGGSESIEVFLREELPRKVEMVRNMEGCFNAFLTHFTNVLLKRPAHAALLHALTLRAADKTDKYFHALALNLHKMDAAALKDRLAELDLQNLRREFRGRLEGVHELLREKYIGSTSLQRECEEEVAVRLYVLLEIYHFLKADPVAAAAKFRLREQDILYAVAKNEQPSDLSSLVVLDASFLSSVEEAVAKRCRPFLNKREVLDSKLREVLREGESRVGTNLSLLLDALISKERLRVGREVTSGLGRELKELQQGEGEGEVKELISEAESMKREFAQLKNSTYFLDMMRGSFSEKYKMEVGRLENVFYLTNLEKYLQDVSTFLEKLLALEERVIANRRDYMRNFGAQVELKLNDLIAHFETRNQTLSLADIISQQFELLESALYGVLPKQAHSQPSEEAVRSRDTREERQRREEDRKRMMEAKAEEERERREAERARMEEKKRSEEQRLRKVREQREQKERVRREENDRQEYLRQQELQKKREEKAQKDEQMKRQREQEQRKKQQEKKERDEADRIKREEAAKQRAEEDNRKRKNNEEEMKRKEEELRRKEEERKVILQREEEEKRRKEAELRDRKKAEEEERAKREQDRKAEEERLRKEKELREAEQRKREEERAKLQKQKREQQLKEAEQRKREEEKTKQERQRREQEQRETEERKREEDRQKADRERKEREKREAEERERKEKERKEREAQEKRKEEEKLKDKERREQQARERDRKAEEERINREKEEKKRKEEEQRIRQQKQAQERKEREDRERQERERVEKQRKQKERLQKERQEKEKLEKERLEKEKRQREQKQAEERRKEEERQRQEKQRKQREKRDAEEKARIEKEKKEKELKEQREREEREKKAEKERQEKEKAEREKAEREKAEREKQQKEKAGNKKVAQSKKSSGINYGDFDDILDDDLEEMEKAGKFSPSGIKSGQQEEEEQYMDDFDEESPQKEGEIESKDLITAADVKCLNEYMKGTTYGRKNKVNAELLNKSSQYILVFEEFVQNRKLFFFDSALSKAVLDLGEELGNPDTSEDDLRMSVETIKQEMLHAYDEVLPGEELFPATRYVFPFSFQNPYGIRVLEMVPAHCYFHVVLEEALPPDEDIQSGYQGIIEALLHILELEGEPQVEEYVMNEETKLVLGTFDKEMPCLLLMFAMHYEHAFNKEVTVNQYTIERYFYTAHIIEPLYEAMKDIDQMDEFYSKLADKYAAHDKIKLQSIAVNSSDPSYEDKLAHSSIAIKQDFAKGKHSTILANFSIEIEDESGEVSEKVVVYFSLQKASPKPVINYFIVFKDQEEQENASLIFELIGNGDEQFESNVYIDYTRHNCLSSYSDWSLPLWAHVITKRKLSSLQAMRALTFAMTPFYLAYKEMD